MYLISETLTLTLRLVAISHYCCCRCCCFYYYYDVGSCSGGELLIVAGCGLKVIRAKSHTHHEYVLVAEQRAFNRYHSIIIITNITNIIIVFMANAFMPSIIVSVLFILFMQLLPNAGLEWACVSCRLLIRVPSSTIISLPF